MKSSLFFLHSDARIVDLIRRGEEDALVILHKANKRIVTAYTRMNSGTEEDADDLLQEALIVVWERVRSGNFQYEAKLSTFIMGIVKNLWRRKLARRKKESPASEGLDDLPTDDPSPLDSLIENERVRHVREGLERLGDPCRRLLLLFYWEEYSLEEIASEMGFANADTVKSKKYQCKKALESLLRSA